MSTAIDLSTGPHLPGAVHELRVEGAQPSWVYGLSNARDMHAVATMLTRDPHAQHPPFALWPDPLGERWWLRIEGNASRYLAARRFVVTIAGRERTLAVGPAIRIRRPAEHAPGAYRVRLETVTPVVIRAAAGTKTRTEPDAGNLASTLGSTLAPRLGLPWIRREELTVRIVEQYTRPWIGKVDGKPGDGPRLGGDGRFRGWHGVIDLECDARTRWLLDCAALIGLGGRVAFGFGRVRVTP